MHANQAKEATIYTVHFLSPQNKENSYMRQKESNANHAHKED